MRPSPLFLRLVAEAQLVAEQVGAKAGWELRHLLAALLCPVEDRQASQVFRALCRESFGADPRDYLPHLLSQVETLGDRPAGWRELIEQRLPGPRSVTVAPLHADIARPSGAESVDGPREVLGITPEAQAFARLICLRDQRPPLSIGLFGDWGSGKTFFMRSLEGEIEQLARQERERRKAAEQAGVSTFVGEVVHIWFNAWHYADANLWASLTAEFFEQLRAGGRDRAQEKQYEQLVRKVAEDVAGARATEAEAGDNLKALENQIGKKAEALAAVERKLALNPNELARTKALKQFENFMVAHSGEVEKGLRALGFRQEGESGEEALRLSLAQLSETLGREKRRLSLLARAVTAPAGVSVPLLGGGLLLALLALLQPWSLLGSWLGPGTLVGGLAAAFAGWRRLWSFLNPVLQAVDSFEASKAELERKLRAERAALETEHRELQEARAQAEQRRAGAAGFVERYGGGSPAALLHYFLHESAELREYEEHLGLVSRVRRSFEKLDELVRQGRHAAARGEVDESLPPLERIVIYIDDLDRCRDEQVVHVLEAVHLLLAFELFVVVVGVDARWLSRSLAKHYHGQLIPVGEANDGQEDSASPADYLEKIFQIPFWLRPLETEAEDGSYARLVDSLVVARKVEPTTNGGPEPDTGKKGSEAEEGGGGSLAAELDARIEQLLAAGEFPAEPPSLELSAELVTLTEAEVTLLKKLGGLAGRSPRAVKRLVNVYRLVRSHYKGPALEEFLGGGEVPAPCASVLFWLAADVGLSMREMTILRETIERFAVTRPSTGLLSIWADEPDVSDRLVKTWDRLADAVGEIGDPSVGDLSKVGPEALRYSFRGGY